MTMQELRFVVSVDAQWHVTISCPQLSTELPARTLRELLDGEGGRFPLPPAGEVAAIEQQDLPGQAFCLATTAADLNRIRNQIVARDVDSGQVKAFGGYLFHALIGPQWWDWIKQTAAAAQANCIELALTWGDHDGNLNRLNWEMMHDGHGFLVAGLEGVAVAVTRRVPGARGANWQPRAFDFPPKILFVVGSALNDPSIRPAAEFLGLLRELGDSGRRVRARVLEKTKPKELLEAVEEFHPDVVHFICHGDWDWDRKRGFLILAPDETSLDGHRYAEQIYAAITPRSSRPPIVLLSACRTGAAQNGAGPMLQGAHELAPLATELVRLGVPVVLGMAGRVSDQACRLFTRQFGSALVQGESLVTATAEARRATVVQGQPAEDSVDWAFPALFMAEQLEPGYSPVRPESVQRVTQQEAWVVNYKLDIDPVFCGRNEFFKAYYGFFGPNPKRVLAIRATGEAGVGKTRLLKELAKQMLRDGHVPVILASDDLGWKAPTSLQALARNLDRAIFRSRQHLGLDTGEDSQLTVLMRWIADPVANKPPDVPRLDLLMADSGELTGLVLRLTLQLDLSALMKDARCNKFIEASNGRAMVLLDSVEQYGPLQDELLSGDLLDGWGLGTEAEPVPVVLAFAGTQPTSIQVTSAVEKVRTHWFNPLPLTPFDHSSEEDLLAYSWIALNPFSSALPDRYVLNDKATQVADRVARKGLEVLFKGLPINLANPGLLSGFTEMSLAGDFVKRLGVDDDDRQLLAAARISPEVER